jgi:hypothetical protein
MAEAFTKLGMPIAAFRKKGIILILFKSTGN